MTAPRLLTALVACALLAVAASPASAAAPPVPGRGYGLPLRTVDGLDDVRAAIVTDDGILTAVLGPGGVVRIDREGKRETLVPWWPAGGIAEAVALARAPDGRIAVADAARSAVVMVGSDGARTLMSLAVNGVPVRPVGIAFDSDRMLVADGAMPQVVVCGLDGSVRGTWAVERPPAPSLTPLLSGIAAGAGTVMVTDSANNLVVALSAKDGTRIAAQGDRGSFSGMWQSPASVAFDGVGFLVTDLLNHRVVRVDAACKPMDEWGMHAVRPREGNGKIHYPTTSTVSPDGTIVAVSEPFERRIQLFGGMPELDPKAPRMTPLPAFEGVSSHFSTEIAVDGKSLLVYEPESASALVFDLRDEPPIHVTTLGGPGKQPGQFGQVTALCVDDAGNRFLLADPVRGVISEFTLLRDGTAPHFDPFMARLVRETTFDWMPAFLERTKLGGPPRCWPVDMRRTPEGTLVILDGFGPRVIELDRDLRPIGGFAPPRSGEGRLVLPTQFAFAHGGDLMVVDAADRAVKRYAKADGAFRGEWKLDGMKRPFGIAAAPATADADAPIGRNRFAITDAAGDEVCVLDTSDGRIVARGGKNGSKPSELWEPAAIDWSPADGRVYVADHGNHRVQTFALDGAWQSSFGIGRAWVRPKDPQATAPVNPEGKMPSAAGAADTRAQFAAATQDADGWWRGRSTDGAWDVAWKFDGGTPPLRDPFGMDVRVTAVKGGAPFEGTLRADAAMPQHGHGMNVAPTMKQVAPGTYRVDGMLFHMPGYWELYFDLAREGVMERAQGAVTLE